MASVRIWPTRLVGAPARQYAPRPSSTLGDSRARVGRAPKRTARRAKQGAANQGGAAEAVRSARARLVGQASHTPWPAMEHGSFGLAAELQQLQSDDPPWAAAAGNAWAGWGGGAPSDDSFSGMSWLPSAAPPPPARRPPKRSRPKPNSASAGDNLLNLVATTRRLVVCSEPCLCLETYRTVLDSIRERPHFHALLSPVAPSLTSTSRPSAP